MLITQGLAGKITEEVIKSLVGIFIGEGWDKLSKL